MSIKSVIATTALMVVATGLQINMYSDENCNQYVTSFYPWTGGCYDWEYSNTRSELIADCGGKGLVCQCAYFTQPGCKGLGSYGGLGLEPVLPNRCVANGGGWKSVSCSSSLDASDLPPLPI